MIIILNFGSQFAHLIARRVRDLGVKAEILLFDTPASEIQKLNPAGIILSGGPASVLKKGSPRPDKVIFKLGIPVLGICYGHQVIAQMLGGKVVKGTHREFGKEILSIQDRKDIFQGLTAKEAVWFSHGDQVSILPKGFKKTASTTGCKYAALADPKNNFYGIQFHPEVTHTQHGEKLLKNFLFFICNAKKNWKISTVTENIIAKVTSEVGSKHVVVGISGGVDSLVAATLIYRAVGNRLHAVFVDTGLLRKGEVEQVASYLRKNGFKQLHVIDASKLFLKRLKGITDPEQKRKIIGHSFIEVFEKAIKNELKKHPIVYLAQGTIYPDRIESASTSKMAAKIKSHHNLALPQKMGFKILEPLKDLYKDEVRGVGLTLGLPRELLWRHPFPGPGLAVRIVGEITEEQLQILSEADAVFIEELRKAGEYEKIWQAFAALLPVKVVGVMGDIRTYEYVIALRAVDSVDGMSADWHKIPNELLEKISSAIIGKVRGVNRVLYDITQKPPATIEYE
ncbi:glutamine-hydrolyzing GMP synthase [Candidatus Kaiserbacteria bacterium RIFCSPHIGHO2_01_FULL_50_13]|uniref:GMP synthase [glutamine-hydrolyzing] n=1 Tax=Candidatus Kaiserbacteria bacterium RIFCSPLOWO2_01_FULL_50_24 TaxID=1798507 RepID=A0A1F6EIQ5_9BACT|nr:MAG: glutamine-hydrolyzing GMP synthase [Candidatus Kaiserbacteria bacterium RIFCSPHIGHO2_01_FULL_50_13]OGG73541.1 MAG: glutamine-hydrolyzing GMP synthase [Candidatus Kaiserbacteria bacterium RIFCSPLOWO2_01_FULL_50_24]